MTTLILLVLTLYLVHILLPAGLHFYGGGLSMNQKLSVALGNRDVVPEPSVAVARARRAQRNFEESLPFFWVLALLLMHLGHADGLAITGAWGFLVARALYLPIYVLGVPGVRSLVWMVGVAGIAMMVVRLHQL